MNIRKKFLVWAGISFVLGGISALRAEVQVSTIFAALNKKFLSAPSSLQALRGVCMENGKAKTAAKCKEVLRKQRVPTAISNPSGATNVWDFIGGDTLVS